MTIRQLRAAGYEYQATYRTRTDAMVDQQHWVDLGYAAEIIYVAPRGEYQLWVR